jgi:protein AFG1
LVSYSDLCYHQLLAYQPLLAIHLQKLYDRLKDYEPTVEYKHRLDQITRAVGPSVNTSVESDPQKRGVWQNLLAQREKRDSLALTKVLTSHEAAMNLDSPRGLMLHGEVGTGKSMLIDLFADCLPNRKKARWHFNTFMLDTFAKLEQLRRSRLSRLPQATGADVEEHSLLWLARDMINNSPILFLDEFQLPDRAASKIMTNLMTSFFQLGGVLIATSNRMPEELHKAAGMAFPPPSRLQSITQKLGLGRAAKGKSENMFAGQGEFAGFLEVLKARCEIWEMSSGKDYRRHEASSQAPPPIAEEDRFEDITDMEAFESDSAIPGIPQETAKESPETPVDAVRAPTYFLIKPDSTASEEEQTTFATKLAEAEQTLLGTSSASIDWQPSSLRVYGRTIPVPRAHNGISSWTFAELCASALGPADYITLASTYHTIILSSVPTLSLLQKNEARRFITLLDALYEARCKLLITHAHAGPDEIFFPEKSAGEGTQDAVYAETFAEAYQDATAPFRPNILSSNPEYSEAASKPDYTHSRFSPLLAADSLEDDPPNRIRRISERERGPVDPDDDLRMRGLRQGNSGPDFRDVRSFTGEDERFAYRRAQSRLWEMCGRKWWQRMEEGWHKPLAASIRSWEISSPGSPSTSIPSGSSSATSATDAVMGTSRNVDETNDEIMFKHNASPFRRSEEPPPKFSWTHIWGTVKWGKKAGAWGQGVEGLKDRKK